MCQMILFGITLTETDKFDGVIVKVIIYNTPRTLEFKICPVFPIPCDLNRSLKFDWQWQTRDTGRQKDKHVGGSSIFELSYI